MFKNLSPEIFKQALQAPATASSTVERIRKLNYIGTFTGEVYTLSGNNMIPASPRETKYSSGSEGIELRYKVVDELSEVKGKSILDRFFTTPCDNPPDNYGYRQQVAIKRATEKIAILAGLPNPADLADLQKVIELLGNGDLMKHKLNARFVFTVAVKDGVLEVAELKPLSADFKPILGVKLW